MSHPIPKNECERLNVLRDLEILDTTNEQRFDNFTREASARFDVPIALISLVDSDRQWFKSKCGLSAEGTPRSVAFCAFVIMSDEVMVVEDAALDPRFMNNPLVVGPPHVRFYAGAPLVYGDNIRLGTLCLVDTSPRQMSEEDIRELARMADNVSAEIWSWQSERADRNEGERV